MNSRNLGPMSLDIPADERASLTFRRAPGHLQRRGFRPGLCSARGPSCGAPLRPGSGSDMMPEQVSPYSATAKTMIEMLKQGDTFGCSQPPVDIKTKVAC